MKRWTSLVVIGTVAGLVACGSDTAAPTLGGPSASLGSTPGTDTSHTRGDSSHTGPDTSHTRPDSSRTPTPTVPAPVANFNLRVTAVGAIVGADTSHAERIAGATVTVVRTGGISGDTLATPQTLGTGTTNGNGEANFPQLPGGFYTIRISPPAGSPYAAMQTPLFPPRYPDIFITATLRRS